MSLLFYDGKGSIFVSASTYRLGWWAKQNFLQVYLKQKVILAWQKDTTSFSIPDAFFKKLFKKPDAIKKPFPLLKFEHL